MRGSGRDVLCILGGAALAAPLILFLVTKARDADKTTPPEHFQGHPPMTSVHVDLAEVKRTAVYCGGTPNTDLAIVEFAGYTCPSCRAHWPDWKTSIGTYHIPFYTANVNSHTGSDEQAIAALRYADSPKFAALHDWMMSGRVKRLSAIADRMTDETPIREDKASDRFDAQETWAHKLGVAYSPAYLVFNTKTGDGRLCYLGGPKLPTWADVMTAIGQVRSSPAVALSVPARR